ncbi:hypothetical protein FRC0485_02393 [Corynebacterium diphtheriae]|nr:hypothetical protein FRC0485_02393 [Corynebacterium diphtheriae]CAB0980390.1 hypothetical protein FRC0497_00010 [Corynebacterium diphtheriae]
MPENKPVHTTPQRESAPDFSTREVDNLYRNTPRTPRSVFHKLDIEKDNRVTLLVRKNHILWKTVPVDNFFIFPPSFPQKLHSRR